MKVKAVKEMKEMKVLSAAFSRQAAHLKTYQKGKGHWNSSDWKEIINHTNEALGWETWVLSEQTLHLLWINELSLTHELNAVIPPAPIFEQQTKQWGSAQKKLLSLYQNNLESENSPKQNTSRINMSEQTKRTNLQDGFTNFSPNKFSDPEE